MQEKTQSLTHRLPSSLFFPPSSIPRLPYRLDGSGREMEEEDGEGLYYGCWRALLLTCNIMTTEPSAPDSFSSILFRSLG